MGERCSPKPPRPETRNWELFSFRESLRRAGVHGTRAYNAAMQQDGLAPGEMVLLVDDEGHRHLVRLREGEEFHHHRGRLRHEDLIGLAEGSVARSGTGRPFVIVRPRLLDYVFEMPRKTGIVYPKDAAQIVMWADVRPGARVLESGLGSGALTLALLRALGGSGNLIGYEARADFIDLALRNVRAFAREVPGDLLVRERDVYEGIVDTDLDRVVLDLPEPWRVVPWLQGTLRPGGWLCTYNPSIVQAAQTVEALKEAGQFCQVETLEVLLRGWHVEGAAVRPEQQMVGHTGFITVGRMIGEPFVTHTARDRASSARGRRGQSGRRSAN